ncbi:40S ribosomal protein S4 [Myotis brandtii]|uniref:40S ribosomal protein S4 n=1 Tax=Myotis brandtii TaxID=109478 RepID=S7Q8M2_MYOBR|nr:40S ribosomal protein S4 [Myotis brandtii]
MLDKLTGVFAPRPSTGPHKLRECLPLIIFLRNRLKYALTGDEVKKICMQRFIKIDGKVRTDITYPAGFMDVISIDKTGENFRLIYDTKGRFAVHRITPEEAKYKLCKVRKIFVGTKGIPHLVTHDARTIRYPDPLIKVNDTIQIDLETGRITDFIKFDTGNLCMVTGGANLGRIGVITNRERHPGSFDVVHVKDANGNSFATRLSNIFVIGKSKENLATNHGFPYPVERVSASPLLKRETRDWRPNRAVAEMSSRLGLGGDGKENTPDKEGTAALDLAKTLSTLLSLLDFKRKSVPSFISGLPATAVLNSNLRSLQNRKPAPPPPHHGTARSPAPHGQCAAGQL